ncbi:MAG: cobaltochelatase subunit CobN [Deltaproteobacteria bacterium]|nr:cobaltochelatase subunit CobN [Deltaproteobacteria bacterium]
MRIALVHGHIFHFSTWKTVAQRLQADGVELLILHQFMTDDALAALQEKSPQVVLADLFRDQPGYEPLLEAAGQAGVRLSLGRQMPPDFNTLPPGQGAQALVYLEKLDPENYYQAIRYLAHLAGGDLRYEPPRPVRTHGVFHPQAPELFPSVAAYLGWMRWEKSLAPARDVVAVLGYHGQLVEENHAELDALVLALEDQGLFPCCVYSEGAADASLPLAERYPWLAYLEELGPDLAGVLNATAGRFLSSQADLPVLAGLNVPVFQGLRLHHRTQAQWRDDPQGLPPSSLVYSLSQPETAGVIEPTLLATDEPGPGGRRFAPVPAQVAHEARRAAAWVRLKNTPPAEKRLALVLHNNPCRGVEATAGQAVGLDAAQSAVELMQALAQAGYTVEDLPADGRDLMALIAARKALSEFRWTTVEQIVGQGGALYLMPGGEYLPWLASLPAPAREKVLADWGEFPGQGMVLEEEDGPKLVISGLQFGNLTLLIQPKRGCYGAKCNGEVCRILHDPALSPPHQWLATYKHLQDTCHAVIHLGAEGALEYLPGKRAALSAACFPEISLGHLPNLYVYVMDVPGEGLMAKRRGRAVIVDHLVPPRRPSPASEAAEEIREYLGQYRRAREMGDTARASEIQASLTPLLEKLKFLAPGAAPAEFQEALEVANRQLARAQAPLVTDGLHVLGRPPRGARRDALLANLLEKPPAGLPSLRELLPPGESDAAAFQGVCRHLGELADGDEASPLAEWLREQAALLAQTPREISQVLAALDGGYVLPGLGGSLSLGQHEALPTGRNFYGLDVTRLPSAAAQAVGRDLADQLLNKFLAEEGRFPASVGLSLWSSDAFKCDGEVCAQVLHLLGVRPQADSRGQVKGVAVIPLSELTVETPQGARPRPRVDVVIQASGILRDLAPHFLELLDQAARLVADLDEPAEWNAPRRHNRERLARLRETLGQEDGPALRRLVASRVFSSQPGSYGLGIGLAIDASAWEDRDDLAETYVNWGGWAYGGGEFGREAHEVFAAHLGGIEISYMKQASPEYDLLDCGGYADFQGGMACAASALSGQQTKLYWGDGGQDGRAQVRGLADELERAVRTRLLSQAWLESLKPHGAQGAGELVNRVLNVYRWSAATGQVAPWTFEALTEHLIMQPENLAWLRQANPHAMEEMVRRLLEAASRDLWQPGPEHEAALESAALEVEGDLEESMGAVSGEFQGSQVEVLTSAEVATWRPVWRLKTNR